MIIGTASILAYTLFGGMWSVAVTDFIQMIILVIGLGHHRGVRGRSGRRRRQGDRAGDQQGPVPVLPEPSFTEIVVFFARGDHDDARLDPAAGRVPARDVGPATSRRATRGPVIGGVCYILFAFVPMFLVTSALIIMPEQATTLIEEDPQKVLPTLVLEQMPFVMQVLFFGALLSAIKSTASATLLAPSVTFVENIWRQFFPR